MCASFRSPSPQRRGAIIFLVTVSLLVMLAFVALAIDMGHIYVSRGEMQVATDAAALAGASTPLDDEATARARARDYAARHTVAGEPVAARELSVNFGHWEWYTRSFTPASAADEVVPNAVRAVGTRNDLSLFFAPLIGHNTADIVRSAVALNGSNICAGIWGLEGIRVAGDVATDSYDSTQGDYGGGNLYANGDLCSCSGVDLMGSVDIHGDIMYGQGYSLDISGGAHEVWGITAVHRCAAYVPDFDVGLARGSNDNYTIGLTDAGRTPFPHGPWRLALREDDNLTLAGGTYYFDSVRMSGQSTLTIAGPTKIYIADRATFGGGGVTNLSQDPADLTIYSTGDTLAFFGTPTFYGSVIAPRANVSFTGTSNFYGTALGRVVEMNGTVNIHVDEQVVFELFDLEPVAPILVE